MGSACCVAARDKTIASAPSNEFFQRNLRHSPTWSFRWENRGRVAGEEASVGWLSDGISRNNGSDNKCETAYASEDGSSLDSYSFQRRTWPKSPLSEGMFGHARTPPSEQSISRNVSMDANLEQAESKESPPIFVPSPTKLSFSSLPSSSSIMASPPSSKVHMQPTSSNPSRCTEQSPKQCVNQEPGSKVPSLSSSNSQLTTEEKPVLPPWCCESTRASYGGSSDSWSMNAFSELMAFSNGRNWSFDGESFHDKSSKCSSRVSTYNSVERQTCGICSKLLAEKSLWSGQKIVANNELSVVAVLVCGHTYHADCLESMTPEIDKYDPSCPVCTFGEKQTLKMSEKALKAELEMRLKKGKRWRNQVVDIDLGGEYASLDLHKGIGCEEKGFRLEPSSGTRSYSPKPFLKRHFSFGSKGSRHLSENTSSRKKGFFWSRSTKE
ncbi:uncharacterized protein LOC116204659 [Punica granatum]|uniref:Uncharacterized protein LOC116204659 n=1 Tax=Punica granatum TaxID=22663 RepID=A0A6P8D6E8_PUNGR|nr:uncharacterized protein LOC116204659 [Punica granatum]XP_031392707.1 uncharacterized protein LOC116204659 [Punica granatum]XP_031392708.1 uncharacterized protein LOC116204659 [Punica granatum]XP_031392709.1 uncharacterized protein LOC116204659 [Punica granatum]XP_031392710.1 uncharacterized protein LOC116204659 [Punica granatum]